MRVEDIKVGNWFKCHSEGRTRHILIVAIEPRRGKTPMIHYFNSTFGGYIDNAEQDWVLERCRLYDKQEPWLVSESRRTRSDFRVFCASSKDGWQIVIAAGCKSFDNFDRATKHWSTRHRDRLSKATNKAMNEHRLRIVRNFKRVIARRIEAAA